MKIQKYFHSCLLIEENGKRLLIDPGHYSFDRGGLLEKSPKIDVILVTHEHGDHCSLPGIKKLFERDSPTVICNSETSIQLENEGVRTKIINIPETIEISGFIVTSVVSLHDPASLNPPPLSNGFYINHRLFHPGDSFSFAENLVNAPDVLALPVIGGWGTTLKSLETGLKIKPKHLIPIHDAFVNDDWINVKYREHGKIYQEAGIAYHPLKIGEVLEI
jgi:L-ascorbate metabolism protein UlaG (beta-lactamase superfamily)